VFCILYNRTQDRSEARMLARTQIENATTEELERLRVRIEAELEGRRGEAEERDHESAVEVVESQGLSRSLGDRKHSGCEYTPRVC
jgi:hypothetical protein